MNKLTLYTLVFLAIFFIIFAQDHRNIFNFNQLFPPSKQKQMGLHKLNEKEKEALHSHVEMLLEYVIKELSSMVKEYADIGGGHWINKNIDGGSYIILEDSSLWEINPIDRIDTSLWLPLSNIMVIKTIGGSPGYDYLLINTDDGEKAYAKYLGN